MTKAMISHTSQVQLETFSRPGEAGCTGPADQGAELLVREMRSSEVGSYALTCTCADGLHAHQQCLDGVSGLMKGVQLQHTRNCPLWLGLRQWPAHLRALSKRDSAL